MAATSNWTMSGGMVGILRVGFVNLSTRRPMPSIGCVLRKPALIGLYLLVIHINTKHPGAHARFACAAQGRRRGPLA
jgi:hypothetical protein